jgi:LmbE family N-acetylglucosaminyl deacetylase
MHTLFVFAHQDDEIAAASRIAFVLRGGGTVSCAYLTNGEGGRATAAVRDEESRVVLQRLGVSASRVHFIGSRHRVPDGKLVEHLERALSLLDLAITETVDEVVCLAWEGGHHDHDASHLVAVAFARHRRIARCVELPLYHGHRMPGAWFRALAPLRVGAAWTARGIGLTEGLRIAALCRFYRSQRKTWLGLLPSALIHLVLTRREWTRAVDVSRLRVKPHEGPLLYERRFGVAWEKFAKHAMPFVAGHLSGD